MVWSWTETKNRGQQNSFLVYAAFSLLMALPTLTWLTLVWIVEAVTKAMVKSFLFYIYFIHTKAV